jgi:hypothetical protein
MTGLEESSISILVIGRRPGDEPLGTGDADPAVPQVYQAVADIPDGELLARILVILRSRRTDWRRTAFLRPPVVMTTTCNIAAALSFWARSGSRHRRDSRKLAFPSLGNPFGPRTAGRGERFVEHGSVLGRGRVWSLEAHGGRRPRRGHLR